MSVEQFLEFARGAAPVIGAAAMALGVLLSALMAINGDRPPMFYRLLLPGPYRALRELREENARLKAQMVDAEMYPSILRSPGEQTEVVQRNNQAPRPQRKDEERLDSDVEMRFASPALAAKKLLIRSLENGNADLKVEEALRLYQVISDQHNRLEERGNLRETTVNQLRSTNGTKSSMISLFVMFNLGIIAALWYVPTGVASAKELILGLYISLAMFIVYVYRAANARALVLLAITEDLKRYHDAEKYMNHLRPNTPPTERDLDVLRLILTNRAEREKNNEHPYELVLKGISNSNIMLKGGKIIPSVKRQKPEPGEKAD